MNLSQGFNSDLNWTYLRDAARLLLESVIEDWASEVTGFSGINIQVASPVGNHSQSIFAFGDFTGEVQRLPLAELEITNFNILFYGSTPTADRYRLVSNIEQPLKWLLASQQQLLSANAFQNSPVIMYQGAEVDGRWILVQGNKALENFLGVDLAEFVGAGAKRLLMDFIHPEDLPKLMTSYDFVLSTSKKMTMHYRLKNASGDYVPVTEYVEYSRDLEQNRCHSVIWHRDHDQVDSSNEFELFNQLDTFLQDISFETGRHFLNHFCRRLEAVRNIPRLILCAPVKENWWETWVVLGNGYVQSNFSFPTEMLPDIAESFWNQSAESYSDPLIRELLFDSYPYISALKLADESEKNQALLLFGTDVPVKDIEQLESLIQFVSVRILRELRQSRIADAQQAQNEILIRQKNQLTNMVTLLGQLDTVADEAEFLLLVQSNLQKAFNLSSLDWVFWSSGEWHRVLQFNELDNDWSHHTTLMQDQNWIAQLERCRREDNLFVDRAKQCIYWPVGQSQAGYLVMTLTMQSNMPDLELLHFSRNALSLALQGLLQRENLRYQAMRDSLTGLGNRMQLHAWIKVALPTQSQASLLLFDLNRFKEINDSFGHQFGDKLLCEIGPRISSRLQHKRHYTARLGGDEFAMFFPDTSPEEARDLAAFISSVLSEGYVIDRLRFQVEASIGLAHYPQHGGDGHELLRCADVAMYEAKTTAKQVVEYQSDLDNTTPLRIAVLSELDTALSEGQLKVVYQPLMSTQTGQTGGFEALVRWTHPEFGPLSPAEFIAIAEMGEGIRKITDFVLRRTMESLQIWRKVMPDLHVAVNISPRVLLDHQFPKIISSMLEEYNLPGESIVMELTESTLLVDPIRAVEIINTLGDIGVKVEIDDYGTGYSSLAYIKSLPISALKIDRSFVCDILQDPTNQVIVSSTIKMAHTLGLQTVAEGVEDEATLLMLLKFGCDMIQGYYYSKPIAEKDVVQWLRRNL